MQQGKVILLSNFSFLLKSPILLPGKERELILQQMLLRLPGCQRSEQAVQMETNYVFAHILVCVQSWQRVSTWKPNIISKTRNIFNVLKMKKRKISIPLDQGAAKFLCTMLQNK